MKNFTLYGLNRPGEEARYVGITSGPLKKRLRGHYNALSNDYRGHWIAEAKRENVKVEIVPYCVGLSEKEACELEAAVIAELRKIGLDLVNTSPGGNLPPSWLGKKHSPEWFVNHRLLHTGKKLTSETRAKISAAKTGVKLSPEICAKFSVLRKGKKQSAETCAKRSAAMTGKKKSPEHRAKLSAANTGKNLSPEHCAAISAGSKGKKKSPAHCAAISAGLTGRKHTPERNANNSAAHQGKFRGKLCKT